MNWKSFPWLLLLSTAIISISCTPTSTPASELTHTPSPTPTATNPSVPLLPGEIPLRFEPLGGETTNPTLSPHQNISLVFLVDRSNSMFNCIIGKPEFNDIAYNLIDFSFSLFKEKIQSQELQIGYLYMSLGADTVNNLTASPTDQPEIIFLDDYPNKKDFTPRNGDTSNNYRLSLMNAFLQMNNHEEEKFFVLITDGDFTDTSFTGTPDNFSSFLDERKDIVNQLHIFKLNCGSSDAVWNQQEHNYYPIENMQQAGQVLKQLIENTSLTELLPTNGRWWPENESKIEFGAGLNGDTYSLSISVWAMGLKAIELFPSTLGPMSASNHSAFEGKNLPMPGPLGGSCELNKENYYMTATSPPFLAYYIVQPESSHKFLRLGTDYRVPTIKLNANSPFISGQEVVWNLSKFDINLIGSFKVDGGDDGIDKFKNCYFTKLDVDFQPDSGEKMRLQTFDVPFKIWNSEDHSIGAFDPKAYSINVPGKLLFTLRLFDQNYNEIKEFKLVSASISIKFYPASVNAENPVPTPTDEDTTDGDTIEIQLQYSLRSYFPDTSRFMVYAVSNSGCSDIESKPYNTESGEKVYIHDITSQNSSTETDSAIEYSLLEDSGDIQTLKIIIRNKDTLIGGCGYQKLIIQGYSDINPYPTPTSECDIKDLNNVTCGLSYSYIANGVYYGDKP